MSNNFEWINKLLRLLRKLLGAKSESPRLQKLEEYYADGSAVFRLDDPSIPGAIDLWRIDRHDATGQFFICVINIEKLRDELGQQRAGRGDRQQSRSRYTDLLEHQLQAQAHIMATHLWITGWSYSRLKYDKTGRAYRSSELGDLNCVAVDLQGLGGPITGDRYALRFARKISFRLAERIDRRESPLRFNTWEEIVKKIDWVDWLEGYARAWIHPTHALQPPRPQRSKS